MDENVSDADLMFLVMCGSWKIEVNFRNTYSDPVVFSCQGIPDIDSIKNRIIAYNAACLPVTGAVIRIDTGRFYDRYLAMNLNDLDRLRALYIAQWGDVAKPQYPYDIPTGASHYNP